MNDARRDTALAVLRKLDPEAPDRVVENFDAFSDDLVDIVLGFAFADVVSRPNLDLRTRELLTVCMLAALGTAPEQLEFHIRAALRQGVSRAEIIEGILQVAVYAGVPAFVNALGAARRAGLANDASEGVR